MKIIRSLEVAAGLLCMVAMVACMVRTYDFARIGSYELMLRCVTIGASCGAVTLFMLNSVRKN